MDRANVIMVKKGENINQYSKLVVLVIVCHCKIFCSTAFACGMHCARAHNVARTRALVIYYCLIDLVTVNVFDSHMKN